MNPLISIFISESQNNLEQAGEALLRLEETPNDLDILNTIFRSVHTIKGSSGLLNVKPLTRVAHALEDILDIARDGKFSISPDIVDLLLESMDQIGAWINNLETESTLPSGADHVGENLCVKLKNVLSVPVNSNSSAKENYEHEITFEDVDFIPSNFQKLIPENIRMQLYWESYRNNIPLISVTYTPDEQCFYTDLDPLLTVRQVDDLCWQKIDTSEPLAALNELDAYRCILRFHLLSKSNLETVRLRFSEEDVNTVKIQEFMVNNLVFPVGINISSELFRDYIQNACTSISQEHWKQLHQSTVVALEMANEESLQGSALRWLDIITYQSSPDIALIKRLIKSIAGTTLPVVYFQPNSQLCLTKQGSQNKIDRNLEQATENILRTQMEILKIPCENDQMQGRLESVKTVLKRVFSMVELTKFSLRLDNVIEEAKNKLSLEPLYNFATEAWVEWKFNAAAQDETIYYNQITNDDCNNANLLPSEKVTECDSSKEPAEPVWQGREDDLGVRGNKIKTLKVDQERVDNLMDLVGELVVAKNSLPFLAKRAEDIYGLKDLSRDIKNQYSVINRISNELQNSVMQVRMVPMSYVFQRFRRLVRDLSRKLSKQIRLIIEGEETEADKNVIEDMADPLIHLVRNSIDHGIELPEIRIKAGKNPEGEIRLCAMQSDGQVVIDIYDDGKGLDIEKLKSKAYEKGLVSEEKLNSLSDQDVFKLIFEPGFSTNDQVSDLSGRGVGMDVVRTVVSEKGGSVSVDSKAGQGTHIQLSLPLTMAISHVMMIEAGGEIFGIPIDNIIESVRIPKESIHRIKNREALILRNRLLPLGRLKVILEMNAMNGHSNSVEEAVLVVSMGGDEFGLVVDKFHEGIDIIAKPLEGFMSSYRMYSGMALLGDGRVLLILNLKELKNCL